MTTNSYLEYFLTLLGWVVNNGLWNAISATGLFALPLLIKLLGHRDIKVTLSYIEHNVEMLRSCVERD
ncbi:hypothetical protein F2V33_21620 [Salmonella enterica subsp. houtenae]|nr:hypothetical protein [Salmonella enterica subsp. houtenae]